MDSVDYHSRQKVLDPNETGNFRLNHVIFWLTGALLAAHIGCVFLLASVPPISRDALVHHLTIPKMYLQHGGIYEIPSMHFSYFPMNLDLLYMLPLYFKNEIAAKYIHYFFALLTAGLLYRYLKTALDKVYGLIGAVFFLSIPVIVKLSVTVYVDLGLIFFSWASLYYFLKWYDNDFRLRFLIFAGIACGLGLGTKYNGLILLLVMSAMVSFAYSIKKNSGLNTAYYKRRYKNSLKGLLWGAAFVLIALVVFSPWMIRNIIWKANPVYPLFNSFFHPPEKVETNAKKNEKSAPRNAFWMRRHVYKESFLETISIPVRAFFQGQDDNPKYFDGKLNPFLLLFPLMCFIKFRENEMAPLINHRNIFSIFAVLFTLFVFFRVDYRIRYMAPALPPLIVLSVFGIKNIANMAVRKEKPVKRIGLGVLISLIISACLYNASYVYAQFQYIRPFDYLLGNVDRDAYISRYRVEHHVIVHANKVLPEDARVLCLSIGDRSYYLDKSVHLAEDFYAKKDGMYFESDLLNKLRRYGTTHIILNKFVYYTYINTLHWKDRAEFKNVFRKYTKVLYKKYGVQLLAFCPDGCELKGFQETISES